MSTTMSSILSSNNIFVYNEFVEENQEKIIQKKKKILKIQKSILKAHNKILYNNYLPQELINIIISFIPIINRIEILQERYCLKNKMEIYFKYKNKNKMYKLYTYANMLKNVFLLSKKDNNVIINSQNILILNEEFNYFRVNLYKKNIIKFIFKIYKNYTKMYKFKGVEPAENITSLILPYFKEYYIFNTKNCEYKAFHIRHNEKILLKILINLILS